MGLKPLSCSQGNCLKVVSVQFLSLRKQESTALSSACFTSPRMTAWQQISTGCFLKAQSSPIKMDSLPYGHLKDISILSEEFIQTPQSQMRLLQQSPGQS